MFRFLRGWFDSGYEKGKLRFLLGWVSDPQACQLVDISAQITDRALAIFCDAFSVPESQMYCLVLSDRLEDVYASFNHGIADDMEYERLAMEFEFEFGCELSPEEVESMWTIERSRRGNQF